MIITYIDRYDRSKQFQPDNREWAITIEYVDNDGFIFWTNNNITLDWIQYFDKYTAV